jgi:O-antigen/teichoic acid export membrane protein
MSNISIGRKDVYWSYVGSFFRLAANILLLPFMLHYLSDDDLGMWYVFAGISQFVVLLDFGFAPALSRNISYLWCGAYELQKENVSDTIGETDYFSLKKLLTTCKYIYLFIALVAFIVLSTVGTFYVLSLETSNNNVLISWVVYGVGVVLNLYYSYFTSFLRGVGAIAENNIAGVISKAIQIILSCVLLYKGMGLLGAAIGYLASGIALRIYSIRAFYNYEDLGKSLKKIEGRVSISDCWKMFSVIWYNASKEGLIMISNYMSSQANTLICSSVLGLASTGSYGISVQLATVVTGLSSIPYATYQPKMLEKILKDELRYGLRIFSGATALFSITFLFLSICTLLSIPLILWLKPSFSVNYSMMTILMIFMFIDKLYRLFSSYISNFNKLPYTQSFVVSAVFSIILSFILAKYTSLGIWALIISPLVIDLGYNAWKWPKYVLNDNNISFWGFVKLGHEEVKLLINKIKGGKSK